MRGEKGTVNKHSGYSHKSVNTISGSLDVSALRDREGSFEPKTIPRRRKDVSGIEDKVLSVYARGDESAGYCRNDRGDIRV